jgi:hypothetical protein
MMPQLELINEIDKINFKNSNLPIISNYDSTINSNIESIIYALKIKWLIELGGLIV